MREMTFDSREAWLELRREGIGGSDAAAILGVSKWEGPLGVYLDKKGERPAKHETFPMKWGTATETVVADFFADAHPEITMTETPGIMYQHETYDWMFATPDRRLEHPSHGPGILEIKTTGSYSANDWADDVPDNALAQTCHYMEVMDVKWGYICVVIGNQEYREFMVWKDEQLSQQIVLAEQDFWTNHILKNVPPPADGLESTAEFLKDSYKNPSNDSVIELDAVAKRALMALTGAKAREKQAKEDRAEAENQLKQALGNNAIGQVNGKDVVTWKKQSRRSFSLKNFVSDPKRKVIADEFYEAKETRVFRVVAGK